MYRFRSHLSFLRTSLSRQFIIPKKPLSTATRTTEESKSITKYELAEFEATFPQLVKDVTTDPESDNTPEVNQWLAKVMEYNVPFGKKVRGLFTVSACKYLTNDLTPEDLKLFYVLGWCVEIMLGFLLLYDDIEDQSITRRGRPCWYKVDGLGLAALNDALLLEASFYSLLRKYFRDKECYVDLLEVFHETIYQTSTGQCLDLKTELGANFDSCTMDRCNLILKKKTGYLTCVTPVFLGMAMARMRDIQAKKQAQALCLEIGHFFQVQDDYLDCFGETDVIGKIGTDIAEGKCSWLIASALERVNPAQRQILKDNYGCNDPDKVGKIKQLYVDLGIPKVYKDFEEKKYSGINERINQISSIFPKRMFRDMLDRLYKRTS